jgi:hypothetical protein
MPKRILSTILLFSYCFFLSSCVAISQRKSWRYRQYSSKTEPTNPFIEIKLEKPVFWLPLPLIILEVSTAKSYLLALDFHTKNRVYKQLDSISYKIQNSDKQLLAAGVLPIANGELSTRSYSPDVHRAQCTTQPLITLGNQRQELTGSFIIYATDINNQQAMIPMEGIALHYFKARIASFF